MGHIEDLIIDEKFRGNGYSKLIVKELIELELVINKLKVALFMNIFSQTAQEINVKNNVE